VVFGFSVPVPTNARKVSAEILVVTLAALILRSLLFGVASFVMVGSVVVDVVVVAVALAVDMGPVVTLATVVVVLGRLVVVVSLTMVVINVVVAVDLHCSFELGTLALSGICSH